jgi:hypothetical protein
MQRMSDMLTQLVTRPTSDTEETETTATPSNTETKQSPTINETEAASTTNSPIVQPPLSAQSSTTATNTDDTNEPDVSIIKEKMHSVCIYLSLACWHF